MKVNQDKFHILLSDKKNHQMNISDEKLSGKCSKKFEGIKIGNKLIFENYREEHFQKKPVKIQCAGNNL